MFNRPEDRFEDLEGLLKAVNKWLKSRKVFLETAYPGEDEAPSSMIDAAQKAESEIDSAMLHLSLSWPNLLKKSKTATDNSSSGV